MDPLFYEVIPPPKNWPKDKILQWTNDICCMLQREKIKAINLPEVINEQRNKERTTPFREKIDNIEYAKLIRTQYPDAAIVPNKVCVHLPKGAFLDWVDDAYGMGIRQLILVGGEHRAIDYPGPPVLEAASLIKERYPDLLLGGITIFTRRDEVHHILQKMKHGIDFFVSQIIFETANMKCVLLNLQKLCQSAEHPMPRIYLSLALATKKSDIQFMQWLGVEFPTAILSFFLDGEEEQLASRVLEVMDFLLEEIKFFLSKTRLKIGVNIEQVMYGNQESGEHLLTLVKRRLPLCQ
ncbi:MAG: mycobacterial-type methylenetetrahydrofolate reductase [Waddliaceae bacterium]